MSRSEKLFSGNERCGHCGNSAPMEIVTSHSTVKSYDDPRSGVFWDEGVIYQLLACPACEGVTLRSYYWHDGRMDESEIEFKALYPALTDVPLGLPVTIQSAYQAALKVRNIDTNAYGVLLGRVLELVCEDRMAQGRTLHDRLNDLASRREIPEKLVGVATGLKDLRNVGAHAGLGDLTPSELPILDNLGRAILEYVYTAPFLATQAVDCLKQVKQRNSEE